VDTLVGTSLGGYTLTRFLGSGGMGAVYLAKDPAIGQQVAIKVVRTDDADYPDVSIARRAAERFKQEARAVASLDHLHILPLYRYGEDQTQNGQRAYMVMQYRPEGSLWDWLRRRAGLSSGESLVTAPKLPFGLSSTWPLSVEEATDYLRQAASALQYAHDRGIVHRDIKPANFLLRFDAGNTVHLLLSDFGLAKLFSSNSATSHILGTPMYMAPEQFEGAAGPESDQYALATMIYYFLAGHPPFEGEPMRLMHQHITQPPSPIRTFNPTLPEGIESTLSRALAKRPADRYPSTAAFADAFAQGMYGVPRGFTPQFSLPIRPQEKRIASTAPLQSPGNLLATYNAPTIQSPQSPPAEAPTVVQAQPAALQAAFAPTLYPASPSSSGQLSHPTLIPSSPPLQPGPASSSNQQRISRRGALGWILGGIAVVTIGGGAGIYFYLQNRTPANAKYVLRGHSDMVTSVYWSLDGSQLVSGSLDRTARLWLVANQQNTVTYAGHHAGVLTVAWSPNGSLLASGGKDKTLQVWDTTGALQHSFSDLGAAVSAVAWKTDGNELFVGTLGNSVHEALLSGNSVTGRNAHVTVLALALSPDGQHLATGLESGNIAVTNLQEQPRRPVVYSGHTRPVRALAWSSDSSMLASGSADTTAQIWDVATGRSIHTLQHSEAVNGVAWDPTSTGRLTTASADGNVRLWNVARETSTVYGGHGGAVTSVAWGSNGLASGSADTNIIIWQT